MDVRVASDKDIEEGGITAAEAEGQELVLVRVEGQVYALEGICNHGLGYLSDGELVGHDIVCPLHAGCFDVRTGAPTQLPCTVPIRTYPVRIEGAEVFVSLE